MNTTESQLRDTRWEKEREKQHTSRWGQGQRLKGQMWRNKACPDSARERNFMEPVWGWASTGEWDSCCLQTKTGRRQLADWRADQDLERARQVKDEALVVGILYLREGNKKKKCVLLCFIILFSFRELRAKGRSRLRRYRLLGCPPRRPGLPSRFENPRWDPDFFQDSGVQDPSPLVGCPA
ncbi:hypothetical protein NN561_006763 [Cricetulus griseus]